MAAPCGDARMHKSTHIGGVLTNILRYNLSYVRIIPREVVYANQMSISSAQKSYLAGFLDGDGSIYARLKPDPTYRYGFQVAAYIVLFQSAKSRIQFEKICDLISIGSLRERNDGILEYTIGRQESLKRFLAWVKPYVLLFF